MAQWCLPPSQVDQFKNAIRSGRIDPEKLADMSSAERRTVFEKELGPDMAEPMNTEFESKLLLKNRQQGYVNWAKKALGENTPAGRDLISRVQRMDKLLSPADEKAFLEDLAARKLGTRVTAEEAQKITELSKAASDEAAKGKDQIGYGYAVVDLRDYVGELKHRNSSFRTGIAHLPETIGGLAKSVKASLDNSYIFRQGWKAMMTNPVIWQRNARKSFVDMVHQFGGKNVLREIEAGIFSDPDYDLMKKAKLDVGTTEEAYPAHLPEKIPVLGRAYKASEVAYTGQAWRTRVDVFKKMLEIARKSGQELDDTKLQNIGRMVNSLTGRGHLGKWEVAAQPVNNIFFSPRFLKSQFDVLMQPVTGGATVKEFITGQNTGSSIVRKQAGLNLLKVVTGTAAILATAKALKPDSVESDPRSADFGKIRIGNTRFDVSGGSASILTLAARMALRSSKSSTTGKISKLNQRTRSGEPKFGAPTLKDVAYDFIENKTSPAFTVALEMLKGEAREGGPPTLGSTARGLFEPMPVANYFELKNNPKSAPIVAAMIADSLGVSTNTYSGKKKRAR